MVYPLTTNHYPLTTKEDCILDFDEDLHPTRLDIIDKSTKDIEFKGRLDRDTMRNIFKQYSRPGVVSRAILIDIHSSFNYDGIAGLKKP